MTNNSTKSRKGYKGKFTSLGLDVQDEEIFSSSFAAAAYLEQKNFKATGALSARSKAWRWSWPHQ